MIKWRKALAVILICGLITYNFPFGVLATCQEDDVVENVQNIPKSEQKINCGIEDDTSGVAVATVEDLLKIEDNPNGDYYLSNDIYISGSDADVFHALCSQDIPFCGHLNGNGHTIRLDIDSEQNEQGLFSVVGNGGFIENVGVLGTISGGCSVGALAGTVLPGGTIKDCFAKADVYGLGENVGGLVGSLYGQMNSCYFIGDVYGNDAVGGLSGCVQMGGIEENCYQIGAVYADGDCGGAVGNLQGGAVSNCSVMQLDSPAPKLMGNGSGVVTQTSLVTSQDCAKSFIEEASAESEDEWIAPPMGYRNEHNDMVVYLPQLEPFVNSEGSVEVDSFPEVILHDYGDGVIDTVDQYIQTAQELQDINNNLKGNYVIASDIDLSDLETGNENSNFEPLGNSASNAFTGKLDGQNYQIKNIKINAAGDYQGLFGYVGRAGVVENVVLTGEITGGKYVGGIAGMAGIGAKVTHCQNRASLKGDSYVGGIVGRLNTSGSISECINYGTVSGGGSTGGIVGSSYAKVMQSANFGTVTGTNNYTGGIAGFLSGQNASLQNCYNIADVTGVNDVGGIIGQAVSSSTVKNTYHVGNIAGKSSVGYVAGEMEDGTTLENSYYDIELAANAFSAVGSGTGSNTGSLTTMQMTGSSAIGESGMLFSDPSLWTMTKNTENDVYFPQLAVFSEIAPPSAPYYQISFSDGDGFVAASVDGYDENGYVIAGGNFSFTVEVSPNGYATPPIVQVDGKSLSYSSVDGMVYTYVVEKVNANKQVFISASEITPTGIAIFGEQEMDYNSSQMLTATVSPDNLLEQNKGIVWSITEDTGKAVLSEESRQSVMVTATQAGSVTVRATSSVDSRVYKDFTINILPIEPIAVFPTYIEVTEGETLSQARISGQSGEGTFCFADADYVVSLQDDNTMKGMYFYPTDNVNYLTLEQEVSIHVVPAGETNELFVSPAAPVNSSKDGRRILVMSGSYQFFQATLGDGTVLDNQQVQFEVSGNESDETFINGDGKLSISQEESAKWLTVTVSIINEPIQSGSCRVMVCQRGDFDGNFILNSMDYYLLNLAVSEAEQEDYVLNPFYDLTSDGLVNQDDIDEFLYLFLMELHQ